MCALSSCGRYAAPTASPSCTPTRKSGSSKLKSGDTCWGARSTPGIPHTPQPQRTPHKRTWP
eukprot:4427106-Pleurochrysis_carterae.AAC.1